MAVSKKEKEREKLESKNKCRKKNGDKGRKEE
jgi:hypothetical protein